ncbi:hypothetical protein [Thalassovita taeanensis]|uniref:Uncharacterized protein n=1 Tax=Thalassovita taeanensis TaxID=657014 RepID=A0A1H9GER9_9RHOB|nr:hypothetical protein [Thalassovita taeanensis]SEQ48610.1 hypothetical protein SAMN04488092_107150 [Thalassovita taeanensis]
MRLTFIGAPGGAQVDLNTGVIANDGYGTATIIGQPWELRGTAQADMFTGSLRDESFILEGGEGLDQLRYDLTGVENLNVDLEAIQATGLWGGVYS